MKTIVRNKTKVSVSASVADGNHSRTASEAVSKGITMSHGNHSRIAYEAILEGITLGELRANQQLIEWEIAEKLGMSRTPVREALRVLCERGYLKKLRSGTLVVVDHTADDVREAYEIKEPLEIQALRLACQRVTDEEVNELDKCQIQYVQALERGDADRLIELNAQFHTMLNEAAGNKQLSSLIENFHNRYYERRSLNNLSESDLLAMSEQHSRMVEALRKRDVRKATKAQREHCQARLKNVLDWLHKSGRA